MSRIEMTRRSQRAIVPSTTEENKISGTKELKWKQLPAGLYAIYFEGGGELPAELSGTWTSVNKVMAAINNYKVKRGY